MATKNTELINNSLSSLASGVTQQYQEGRFDSQVEAMNNCIPSITRGVLRRNPLVSIGKLADLKVWDLTLAVPAYRDLTTAEIANSFVYSYDRGTGTEQYIVIIPGNGDIHTYNVDGTKLSHVENKTYLSIADPNVTAVKAFKAMTIGDLTFILNRTIEIDFNTTITAPGVNKYENTAFYWIKKTISVVTDQYSTTTGATGATPTTKSGSLMKGYTYKLNGLDIEGAEETRPTYTPFELNTSVLLAKEFALPVNSPLSLVDKYKGSIAYNTNFTGTKWAWSDSFGDEASLGVWKNISDSDKLPANLPEDLHDFVVKVAGGTSAEFDDYYLQYSYDNKTWKEIAKPGSYTTLDASTMPHVLYALRDPADANGRVFAFDEYNEVSDDGLYVLAESMWGTRTSGGDDSLEDPSFIGSTLNNLFFHKNRMGFITDDNVILSRTGDYGNFFIQTLQEVLDDDPIDLAVASKDVTILRHAVSTAGQLILFSDDSQFSLDAAVDGPLTPKTADIVAISNYAYGASADAVAVGNRVFFAHKAGGSSQLFSYKINDQGSQITEATPMTIHLPTYISNSVTHITGHDVLGYTFLETEGVLNELTVLSSITRGSEELQNAFHRWVFAENIASTQIINSALYILFTTGEFGKISLEVPSDISEVNYIDEYSTGSVSYPSNIVFSEFFIRDGEGKGTVRGRYQLRTMKHTITENSKYLTTIGNSDLSTIDLSTMFGLTWDDTGVWDDNLQWTGINPIYTREYENDDLITVMTDSKKAQITFGNSITEPTKGFEIATTNIEGFFHQRSLRR